jgi:hypothetical protein
LSIFKFAQKYSFFFTIFIFSAFSSYTIFSVWHFLDDALAALQPTGWRLGAAAGFSHYFSNPHFPPPLRQTARCRLVFFRECCLCRFHYIVGLHTVYLLNFKLNAQIHIIDKFIIVFNDWVSRWICHRTPRRE